MKSRRGITLIETMVAGAISAIVLTAAFEGIVVAAKVAHENAQILSAEAYAWETAWTWLNRRYADVNAGTYTVAVSSNDCPAICRAAAGADAVLSVQVQAPQQVARHGQTVSAKRIAVDVAWGMLGRRKSLNALAEPGTASCQMPIVVWKTEIERGQ